MMCIRGLAKQKSLKVPRLGLFNDLIVPEPQIFFVTLHLVKYLLPRDLDGC